MKTRYYVIASSLGTYFGLYQQYGTSPLDQLEIDFGNEEANFDDKALERMDLGKTLEDPVLNFFETKLNISITERNEKDMYAFDGLLKCKIDGFTNYQGVPTGVECKISNSSSGSFIENIGYIMQCQAYMAATGANQWLLLGLYNGKPELKVVYRNEEMIHDIEEMVVAVSDILNGLKDKEEYPWHLVEKYSKTPKAEPFEPDLTDHMLIEEYADRKAMVESYKENEARIKELEDYFKSKYTGVYSDDTVVITIGTTTRKGTIDVQQLALDHPEIDIEKYRGPESSSKSIRYKKAKS